MKIYNLIYLKHVVSPFLASDVRPVYTFTMIIEDKISLLRSFFQEKQRLPSYSEMMPLLGYKSKGGVSNFVERLIEHNVVGKEGGKLYPINLNPQVRVLGVISAGFPSMGEEIENEQMSLDSWMISDPESTYLLEVEGDSMIDAGIRPHDYVVVQRGKTFTSGDIVVAELDGEWTMKYLRMKAGQQYLEPANDQYPDMYAEESLNLHAKVVGVVRRYE